MELGDKHYHRIVRMQPDAFRGEIVNIGVLIFNKDTQKSTLELLPIDHPKVSSVVLKGMTRNCYERLSEIVTDIFESVEGEQIDPFDADEEDEDVIILHSLIEKKVIFFSQPSFIRTGANLEQVQASLMKTYVQ